MLRHLMTSWHLNIRKVKIWLPQERKELSKWHKYFLVYKVLSFRHTKQTSKNVGNTTFKNYFFACKISSLIKTLRDIFVCSEWDLNGICCSWNSISSKEKLHWYNSLIQENKKQIYFFRQGIGNSPSLIFSSNLPK